jgi:hypothetical protein
LDIAWKAKRKTKNKQTLHTPLLSFLENRTSNPSTYPSRITSLSLPPTQRIRREDERKKKKIGEKTNKTKHTRTIVCF